MSPSATNRTENHRRFGARRAEAYNLLCAGGVNAVGPQFRKPKGETKYNRIYKSELLKNQ